MSQDVGILMQLSVRLRIAIETAFVPSIIAVRIGRSVSVWRNGGQTISIISVRIEKSPRFGLQALGDLPNTISLTRLFSISAVPVLVCRSLALGNATVRRALTN